MGLWLRVGFIVGDCLIVGLAGERVVVGIVFLGVIVAAAGEIISVGLEESAGLEIEGLVFNDKLFDGFFVSTCVAEIYIVLINIATISAIRAESIFCANINSITRFLISIIFSIIVCNLL